MAKGGEGKQVLGFRGDQGPQAGRGAGASQQGHQAGRQKNPGTSSTLVTLFIIAFISIGLPRVCSPEKDYWIV